MTVEHVLVGVALVAGATGGYALARLLDRERFDRVVVPASADGGAGLVGDPPRF